MMHAEREDKENGRNDRPEDGELSDAELGGVSGGFSFEDFKKKVNNFGEQVIETFSGAPKPSSVVNSSVEVVQHIVGTVKPPVNPIDTLPKPPSILSGLVDSGPKSPKQNVGVADDGHSKPKLEDSGGQPTIPKVSQSGEQSGQPKLGQDVDTPRLAKIEEVKKPSKSNAPLIRPGLPIKG